MQSIGERIKEVREKAELSQKAFGNRIELSQTAVTALENNQSEPRLGTFNKIVEAFRINPEWLRTGKGEIKPSGATLPTDPAPQAPHAGSMQIVAETPMERQLKRENKELREQLQFMRDLMRSGGDLTKLARTGTDDGPESFNSGNLDTAETTHLRVA